MVNKSADGWVRTLTIDLVNDGVTAATWVAARSRLGAGAVLPLATVAGVASIAMSQVLSRSRRTARLCYWTGFAVTTALLAAWMAESGRPLRQIALAVVLCLALAVFLAYFVGWQLKIGGRTRSIWVVNTWSDPPEDGSDRPPPPPPPADSYMGVITAAGFWWIAVVLVAMVSANVCLFGWGPRMILGIAALSVGGLAAGVDDATRQLPMARGQKVQATIGTVASTPVFFLPAALYILGYVIGTKHPMGYGSRDPLSQRKTDDVDP